MNILNGFFDTLPNNLVYSQRNTTHFYWLRFDENLKIKDEIYNESKKKTVRIQEGYSLCHTCIGYLNKSRMPPMCAKNSLEVPEIPDCIKNLTNVEKQLIVKNLVFIKIRQLPKTRMAAMNDR